MTEAFVHSVVKFCCLQPIKKDVINDPSGVQVYLSQNNKIIAWSTQPTEEEANNVVFDSVAKFYRNQHQEGNLDTLGIAFVIHDYLERTGQRLKVKLFTYDSNNIAIAYLGDAKYVFETPASSTYRSTMVIVYRGLYRQIILNDMIVTSSHDRERNFHDSNRHFHNGCEQHFHSYENVSDWRSDVTLFYGDQNMRFVCFGMTEKEAETRTNRLVELAIKGIVDEAVNDLKRQAELFAPSSPPAA